MGRSHRSTSSLKLSESPPIDRATSSSSVDVIRSAEGLSVSGIRTPNGDGESLTPNSLSVLALGAAIQYNPRATTSAGPALMSRNTVQRPIASLLAHSENANELLPHLHQHALDVTGGIC